VPVATLKRLSPHVAIDDKFGQRLSTAFMYTIFCCSFVKYACLLDMYFSQVLNEFGNVFNIHAHSFLIDANVANSPSMKAFKTALSDFKTEIVDVRNLHYLFLA